MLFHCLRVEANFPAEKLCLVNHGPARLVWDEHGGTFVLRVEGLEARDAPEPKGTGIFLGVSLPEAESLAQLIENFAGAHDLRLTPGPAGAELAEAPLLAACHIPGKNLFLYCETPQFTARLTGTDTLDLQVAGAFKARRVPCQETDLIIHLDPPAMCRLLAGLLAWAKKGE